MKFSLQSWWGSRREAKNRRGFGIESQARPARKPSRRLSAEISPNGHNRRYPGGKIICLAALCDDIPVSDLISGLAEAVREETGREALWLRITENPTGGISAPEFRDGIFHAEMSVSDPDLWSLRRALERYAEQFPFVLVEIARRTPFEALLECWRCGAAAYPILRQNGESLFEFNLLVRETRSRVPDGPRLMPLVYLAPQESAHGLSRRIDESAGGPIHFYLRADPPGGEPRLPAGLRRLAREICGCRVGLALSSGAARSLSHIGVIQVLEENGIEVDAVAGSSMGAYIAAAWGKGYSGTNMEKFAREVEGYRGLWRPMDTAIWPRRGFLLNNRVRKRLEDTIGKAHFSDLARPIRIVSTRLDTLDRVIFSGGSVVDAVLASTAIPGVCVPMMIDGVPYIDGGVSNPLPVDVLIDMGITRIIAVNTIAPPSVLHACQFETGGAGMARTHHRVREKIGSMVNPFARGNVFDVIMRSLHAAQTRLAEDACKRASVVLRPLARFRESLEIHPAGPRIRRVAHRGNSLAFQITRL